MTVKTDLTPAKYGIGAGKLVITGTTEESLQARLLVELYNDADQRLDSRYVPLQLSDQQKRAIINAVSLEIDDLEARTGLTKFEPPQRGLP